MKTLYKAAITYEPGGLFYIYIVADNITAAVLRANKYVTDNPKGTSRVLDISEVASDVLLVD